MNEMQEYRFACGSPVKVGDQFGDLVVDKVEGTPEAFSVTYTTPGGRVTVTMSDVQNYRREEFAKKVQEDVAGVRMIEEQLPAKAASVRITINFPTDWSEGQQVSLVRTLAQMATQLGCGVVV